jgi:hypothetical protein
MMANQSFSFQIRSSHSAASIFALLLDVPQWWSGLHAEVITGASSQIGGEFTFSAGNGVHYSKHKLVELVPNKKIGWLVTEANLTFLSDPAEWMGTKIVFELVQNEGTVDVTFTHEGLVPQIECYDRCYNAWSQYMEKLKIKLA